MNTVRDCRTRRPLAGFGLDVISLPPSLQGMCIFQTDIRGRWVWKETEFLLQAPGIIDQQFSASCSAAAGVLIDPYVSHVLSDLCAYMRQRESAMYEKELGQLKGLCQRKDVQIHELKEQLEHKDVKVAAPVLVAPLSIGSLSLTSIPCLPSSMPLTTCLSPLTSKPQSRL